MMGGMAANSYSRKLSDHIFNFNHEVERERELEVDEVVNSQRPAPVMCFLQQGCITPTQTVPPNEDQALQHLSLWGGGWHFSFKHHSLHNQVYMVLEGSIS